MAPSGAFFLRRAWALTELEPGFMRCLLCMLLAATLITSVHADDKKMKEIQYRGGIVSFSIPKHWAEEYEPDGGGMFYEDAPDTGTLRLNIITTRSPKPVSPETAYEELISTTRTKAASVQRLGNGNAMATWVTRSTEEGRDVTFFWWQVANPILPDHLRLALFSYAILTSQEQSESMQRELQLLTESIKNAKFHPTIGE